MTKHLRRSVGLSFVLATLALTWYAADMYYGFQKRGGERGEQSGGHPQTTNQTNGTETGYPNQTTTSTTTMLTVGGLLQNATLNETTNAETPATPSSSTTTTAPAKIKRGNAHERKLHEGEKDHDESENESSEHNETNPKSPEPPPSVTWWEATTNLVYGLGTSWWILTCLLAYLGPLVVNHKGCYTRRRKRKPSQATQRKQQPLPTTSSMLPWKKLVWALVILPSVLVYAYGLSVGIPAAVVRILGPGGAPSSAYEWVSVLLFASAMPTGTAGMVSMGIYVFGSVAKHSPLWSAYAVLPRGKNGDPVVASPGHANLMRDALRLHQWAGYVTFVWFLLHSLLFGIVYGVYGLRQHLAEAAAEAAVNATAEAAATAAANATSQALGAVADAPGAATSGKELAGIFLASVWRALVPPPECRPILGGETPDQAENSTKDQQHGHRKLVRVLHEGEDHGDGHQDQQQQQHASEESSTRAATNTTRDANAGHASDAHPCYGYYRNFNGFLAISAFVALVLTSLTFVRRKNYRFFYVSHIVLAIVFVVTMVFHMKRIVLYLLPSLVCYFATTVPTLVQGWMGALLDGGVRIENATVLESSTPSKKDDGVVELTFLVDASSLDALETSPPNGQIDEIPSYRPKSVRICVPSISLLWYPFTVIEPPSSSKRSKGPNDSESNVADTLVECKVLFGTVGYFTKTFWKRLRDLQDRNGGGYPWQNDRDVFDDEDAPGNQTTAMATTTKKIPICPPLALVDGFYSGASDWIESARSHDVLLIAAGGTGVTPFLTFMSRLLTASLHRSNHVNDVERLPPSVSFLWCCRDEALIRHVALNYLFPLFRMLAEEERRHEHGVRLISSVNRFRVMIYNTSRDPSDSTPLNLSPTIEPSNERIRSIPASRGQPMQSSRLQHRPVSAQATVLAGAITFLSTALFGLFVQLWVKDLVYAQKYSFAVRAYGLYAVVGWSFLMGIVAEVAWRFRAKLSRHFQKGYAIANHSESSEGGGDESIDIIERRPDPSGLNIRLLEPDRLYSFPEISNQAVPKTKLEFTLTNGRPILEHSDDCYIDEDDESCGDAHKSPSETVIEEVAKADRPGVFYCGPEGLLKTIKTTIRNGRKRGRIQSHNCSAECIFYEESFEM